MLHIEYRITPAYTGNTETAADYKTVIEDHPRIHGEHWVIIKLKQAILGSPPHTRGTHF